jgi:Ca2+-binding EF-hand superfamily protein
MLIKSAQKNYMKKDKIEEYKKVFQLIEESSKAIPMKKLYIKAINLLIMYQNSNQLTIKVFNHHNNIKNQEK